MANKIDFFGAFGIPKVDREDVEGGIYLAERTRVSVMCLLLIVVVDSSLDVELRVRRGCILNDELNAWGWCYGPSVL